MPPDTLTDRAGASRKDKRTAPALPPDVDLDDLGADPEPVHSISHLLSEKGTGADLARFNRAVAAMLDQDTQTLILRIATAADPLILWELHQELDRRSVLPCLRWPANKSTDQAQLVTVLADLLWFTRRNPDHAPSFKDWARFLQLAPGSDAWHSKIYEILMRMRNSNLARQGTKALALDDTQRQELMMFPSSRMATARRELQPTRFAEIEAALLSHAHAHPDKDRERNDPATAATRRARLWRVSVLTGHATTATAKYWELLTGEAIARRMIPRRIEAIKTALKSWV
jgi:hypothetical protein